MPGFWLEIDCDAPAAADAPSQMSPAFYRTGRTLVSWHDSRTTPAAQINGPTELPVPQWSARGVGGSRLVLDADNRQIRIQLAPTEVTPIYIRCGPMRLRLSTDPRRLLEPFDTIDPRGILSLLQFGTVIPPLSCWQNVSRARPGLITSIQLDDLRINEAPIAQEPAASAVVADSSATLDQQADIVVAALDATLSAHCPNGKAVILFSGGVDSSLLATRAKALGWRDVTLVNYAMSDDDPESAHAAAIAQELGFPLERIVHNPANAVAEFFDSLADVYPISFADHSAVPTFVLARAVAGMTSADQVIFDGTGADGAFGLFDRVRGWRRAAALPRAIVGLASAAYGTGGFWRRPSAMEHRLRILRRCATMPLLAASVAQNPLDGLAYHFPSEIALEVHDQLLTWINDAMGWTTESARLSAADLMLICAGIFAQKDKPVFDAADRFTSFPFLDPTMIQLALSRASQWPSGGEPKAALKHALARQVRPELVYRAKSGFVAPVTELFASQAFLAALDEAISGSSPIAPYLDSKMMRRLRESAALRVPLPAQTHSLMWAVAVAGRWLK
jgi:asparagine synthetase B (glutamine-hydrolysing)